MINITDLTLEVLTAAFFFNKWARINIEGYDVDFEYTVYEDGALKYCNAMDTAPIEVYMEGKRDLVISNARAVLRQYMMLLFGDTVFDEDYAECDEDYSSSNAW